MHAKYLQKINDIHVGTLTRHTKEANMAKRYLTSAYYHLSMHADIDIQLKALLCIR